MVSIKAQQTPNRNQLYTDSDSISPSTEQRSLAIGKISQRWYHLILGEFNHLTLAF